VPVIGAALFLLGLIVAGRMALEHLRDQQRFALPFSDIDCPPPPGMERDEFLSEVRYLTGLPAQMRLLNDDLPAQLASAFARHPWVEQVEEVAVTPPRLVRVRLAFRRPVLAVPYAGQLRAVDRHGVLLPATAPTDGLPVFDGQAHPPNGPAGTRWGDEAVEGAARGLGPGAAGG
jgi:hypothetical protein